MPTHDTYLDNGTDIGLTVGSFILSYARKTVNILRKNHYCLGKVKTNFRYLLLLIFLIHFYNHLFANESNIDLQKHQQFE